MKINPDIRRFITSLDSTYEWARRSGWAPVEERFMDVMADTMESEMKWLHIPDSVVETLFLWVLAPDSLPYSTEYGLKILRLVRERH